jgi:hypothetical protein
VIGNHNVSFFIIDFFPANNLDFPGRKGIGIVGTPKRGKKMKNFSLFIKGIGYQKQKEAYKKENYDCDHKMNEPQDGNDEPDYHIMQSLL